MRLWSIHPKYLDSQGLVALWREALLAQKVLAGKTRGYRHHPQLIRFQASKDPMAAIGVYLHGVESEAASRNYKFDRTKILNPPGRKSRKMPVTRGQLVYETTHLLLKLKTRDPELHAKWESRTCLAPHPLFERVPGRLHDWEKTTR